MAEKTPARLQPDGGETDLPARQTLVGSFDAAQVPQALLPYSPQLRVRAARQGADQTLWANVLPARPALGTLIERERRRPTLRVTSSDLHSVHHGGSEISIFDEINMEPPIDLIVF